MRNLIDLIRRGETHGVEFKESLSLKDEIGEEVSAFSNTNTGIILVGVDKSGSVAGVQIGKKTVEDLANYIKVHTDNHVFPKISVEQIDGKDVIVIDVRESSEKPVFFKGKAYRRVGNSSHKLSASEMRALAKESGPKAYWDNQICDKATLDDIDWNFVREFFIPRYEKYNETEVIGNHHDLLEAIGCTKDNSPTNAGMMLFGKNPQNFIANSYIALARYKEKEVATERLDYKEFTGNLFRQVDSCDQYIKDHVAMMGRLLPYRVEREDIPEYPWYSIRELIINAVCHRDYASTGSKVIIKMFKDHIEYYNPGGLPDWINPQNITTRQYSRNRIIARVLSKIRYIEEIGEGWDKIIREHNNHPLKPKLPEIIADSHTFIVRIFSTKEKFDDENKNQKYQKTSDPGNRKTQVLMYLEKKGRITRREYGTLFNTSERTARRELKQLVDLDLIKQEGQSVNTYYVLKKESRPKKPAKDGRQIYGPHSKTGEDANDV